MPHRGLDCGDGVDASAACNLEVHRVLATCRCIVEAIRCASDALGRVRHASIPCISTALMDLKGLDFIGQIATANSWQGPGHIVVGSCRRIGWAGMAGARVQRENMPAAAK